MYTCMNICICSSNASISLKMVRAKKLWPGKLSMTTEIISKGLRSQLNRLALIGAS